MNESTNPQSDDEDMSGEFATPSGRRRSPLISAIVVLLGGYLLATMFADVRYFLRGSEPVDLGTADAWVESGALETGEHDEAYVTLRGTPDVQTAARYKLDDRNIRLLRLVEGEGKLFVAVEGAGRTDRYDEVFTGRLRRLSNTRILPWIEQYYADLKLTRTADLDPASFREALTQAPPFAVKTVEGGEVALPADAEVSLVVAHSQARVQLGRASFKSEARARKALEDLGYPFFAPEQQRSSKFYQYWVAIPEAQRQTAQTKLNAGLEDAGSPKATHGAVVLPSRSTYVVSVGDIKPAEGGLRVVFNDQMPTPGYKVEGGQLIEQPLASDGTFSIDASALEGVRLQQPLLVDPDGYILNGGETPSEHLFSLCLWLAVLVVVGLNVTSLVLYWRSRDYA